MDKSHINRGSDGGLSLGVRLFADFTEQVEIPEYPAVHNRFPADQERVSKSVEHAALAAQRLACGVIVRQGKLDQAVDFLAGEFGSA
jgi:hypothetical protein